MRKYVKSEALLLKLVQMPAILGATRSPHRSNLFLEIRHYLYGGDTALHAAAAGFRFELAEIHHCGASCAAKNRRGAEPLSLRSGLQHVESRLPR